MTDKLRCAACHETEVTRCTEVCKKCNDSPARLAFARAHAHLTVAAAAQRTTFEAWHAERTEKSGWLGKKVQRGKDVILVDEVFFYGVLNDEPARVSGQKYKLNGELGANRGTFYLSMDRVTVIE